MKQHWESWQSSLLCSQVEPSPLFAWFQSSSFREASVQGWCAAQLGSFCRHQKPVPQIKKKKKKRESKEMHGSDRRKACLYLLHWRILPNKVRDICAPLLRNHLFCELDLPVSTSHHYARVCQVEGKKKELVHQGLTSCFSAMFAPFCLFFLILMFSVMFQISFGGDCV